MVPMVRLMVLFPVTLSTPPRLARGDDQVAHDPCHHHADEEDQSRPQQIGQECDDVFEQAVDRPRNPAEFENVENDQQAEQPDQQADDLAQRFAQRLPAAGPPLEEVDGIDEFGEGPFGSTRDEPGHDQRDDCQKDLFPQLHRHLFIETITVENHETSPHWFTLRKGYHAWRESTKCFPG